MGKFSVSYTYHVRASETIEASSLEAAQTIVNAKVEDDSFDPGVDDIDDVNFTVQQTHPITRDGRELWTTYVKAGDLRGHQSALNTAPLFSGVPEPKEAALAGAAA